MKRLLFLLFAACWLCRFSFSQPTTAMDFTMSDCATGKVHNLYSILDSGNAVIMEFFMDNCPPCVDAGKALDSMYLRLKQTCPNVRFFQTVFNNTDNCTTVNKWINTNGFNSSVPFDSGVAQISYYGFFAMPTVAVAAGSSHKLLYLHVSGAFNPADTAVMTDSIRNFCFASGMSNAEVNSGLVSVHPNPSPDGKFILDDRGRTTEIKQIKIYDCLGRMMYFSVLRHRSSVIDLSSQPKGIYFLHGSDGTNQFSKKLVIQ